MPTYEYVCSKCGHGFEEFQSINAKPLRSCPKCKGKVKRIISPSAGFILKGPGFYATEYRSESYKSEAKAEKEGSSAKSDTKSGTKKEGSPSKKESSSSKADTKKKD